jgi:hypothetical protein
MWLNTNNMPSIQNLNGPVADKKGKWAFTICICILLIVCLLEIHKELKHLNMLERLSKNGATNNAIITDKGTIHRKVFDTYVFHYKYQINNEAMLKHGSYSVVKKHIYKSKNKGDTIVITYNQLNPLESSHGNILNVSKQQIFKNNWFYYLALTVSTFLLLMLTIFSLFDGVNDLQKK